ncbi:MAG: hypothetical protein Q4P78_00475 [Rothia sp. (in: high G+C Gram-positive bacteria)]|nr:hypothetical protein [Rothia sp. (in: high G+C Gram-positive bacteria)]
MGWLFKGLKYIFIFSSVCFGYWFLQEVAHLSVLATLVGGSVWGGAVMALAIALEQGDK